MFPDNIFLFFKYKFIITNRIKSGKSMEKKEGKKCVSSYADLGVALTDIRRGTAKKISSEKLHYRKV